MHITLVVVGGTTERAILRMTGSDPIKITTEPGESGEIRRTIEFRIASQELHAFCLETNAAGEAKTACAYCDVLPPVLPTLELRSPEAFNALVDETTSISVVNVTGKFIYGLKVIVQWGDGSPNTELENFKPNTLLRHVFLKPGIRDVTATLIGNRLSTTKLMGSINVFPIIERLWCKPRNNRYFLKLGEDVVITINVHASGTFNVEAEGDNLIETPPTSMKCE